MFSSTTSVSQDASQAADRISTSDVFEDLQKSIDEIIDEGASTLSKKAYATRASLLAASQNIDLIKNSDRARTASELTALEVKLRNDGKDIVRAWTFGDELLDAKSKQFSAEIASYLRNIPEYSGYPAIVSFAPGFVISEAESRPFEVAIQGANLLRGSPGLTFGQIPCALKTSSDDSLVFSCPGSIFRNLNQLSTRVATLSLFRSASGWARYVPFTDSAVSYDIDLVGVPRRVGSFSVRAKIEHVTQEKEDQSKYFDFTNSHCSSPMAFAEHIKPRDGWKILESSVRVSTKSVTPGSAGLSLRKVEADGFDVVGRVLNRGKCIKVFGSVQSKDARGWVKGTAHWTEVRDVVTGGTVDAANGILEWGRPARVSLPADATGFAFSLRTLSGESLTLTRPEISEILEVKFDSDANVVTLLPAELGAVLDANLPQGRLNY